MVVTQLVERRSRVLRERNAGLGQNQIEEQPATARVVRRLDRTADIELALGVRLGCGQRVSRDADAVPPHRFADPRPVRKHEHAAGVEENSLEGHVRILA
jgi:hypothetical protein